MDILLLCTEAFGGQGGIQTFNRDLCRALSSDPLNTRVVVLPRVASGENVEKVPQLVDYRPSVAGGKYRFSFDVVRTALSGSEPAFDVVICGHINLLPVAMTASWIQKAPLLLVLHGVEAWEPHSSLLVRWALPQVSALVAVSQYTKEQFLDWAPISANRSYVVPDCIDLGSFGPGPGQADLLSRYGLTDRTIIMTLGRLARKQEYRKGHEEVLNVLPELADEVPNISYLICGDGDNRPELEQKAKRLGVADRVVFTGYVPEEEKEDHYRLADAFVMPGRGEGFGIVYLEAMACGVPVVASKADASKEAVRGGELGTVVDPDDPDSLKQGIRDALSQDRGVPDGLEYFSFHRFCERWARVIEQVVDTVP